jgi:ParB-like chromosome segregation protein Spo0J
MQYLPILKIKRNLDNPRIIKDHEFRKLCKSIKENKNFFESRPIIVDSEYVIVAGNQRYEAAIVNGMKTIPVHVLPKEITQKELDSIALLDNRHNGHWDWDKLANNYGLDVLIEDFEFTDKELGLSEDVRVIFNSVQDDIYKGKEDVTETEYQYNNRKQLEEEAQRIAKEKYEAEKAKIERETREQVLSEIRTGKQELTIDMLPKKVKDEIIETSKNELSKEELENLSGKIKDINDFLMFTFEPNEFHLLEELKKYFELKSKTNKTIKGIKLYELLSKSKMV